LLSIKEEEKNSFSEMFHVKGEMDSTGGESSASEVLQQTSQPVPSRLGSPPAIKKLVRKTTTVTGNSVWKCS
jgi:hypothetical protein